MTLTNRWDVAQRLGSLRQLQQSGKVHPDWVGWIRNEIEELERVQRRANANG